MGGNQLKDPIRSKAKGSMPSFLISKTQQAISLIHIARVSFCDQNLILTSICKRGGMCCFSHMKIQWCESCDINFFCGKVLQFWPKIENLLFWKMKILSKIKCQSRFAVRNGKKQFLASYWFVEQGTSEGPEGFQADSK